jgi:hypothetical protein
LFLGSFLHSQDTRSPELQPLPLQPTRPKTHSLGFRSPGPPAQPKSSRPGARHAPLRYRERSTPRRGGQVRPPRACSELVRAIGRRERGASQILGYQVWGRLWVRINTHSGLGIAHWADGGGTRHAKHSSAPPRIVVVTRVVKLPIGRGSCIDRIIAIEPRLHPRVDEPTLHAHLCSLNGLTIRIDNASNRNRCQAVIDSTRTDTSTPGWSFARPICIRTLPSSLSPTNSAPPSSSPQWVPPSTVRVALDQSDPRYQSHTGRRDGPIQEEEMGPRMPRPAAAISGMRIWLGESGCSLAWNCPSNQPFHRLAPEPRSRPACPLQAPD